MGSEAVMGVWNCLALFGKQSCLCCRQIGFRMGIPQVRFSHTVPIPTETVTHSG